MQVRHACHALSCALVTNCWMVSAETSFIRNEFTTPIVDAKLQILDMCLTLFDYRMNARMHKVFATYDSCYSKATDSMQVV